ncbi:echinoderm microtubule-associated protein-like 3 [Platysternon megacephalum]|uniref:Eyes absent homolog n=1 Tax=Platysternon megacephalum TaxID=55544 RepID=A0A4D9DNQ4_9SAUR|nr:echinoderm microtubule-associated protein-like 3 [Platysternon megacephalum]
MSPAGRIAGAGSGAAASRLLLARPSDPRHSSPPPDERYPRVSCPPSPGPARRELSGPCHCAPHCAAATSPRQASAVGPERPEMDLCGAAAGAELIGVNSGPHKQLMTVLDLCYNAFCIGLWPPSPGAPGPYNLSNFPLVGFYTAAGVDQLLSPNSPALKTADEDTHSNHLSILKILILMEEAQDLPEQPVKKAKMQESGEQNLSQVSTTEVSDQKSESSSLGPNLPMSSEITDSCVVPEERNCHGVRPYAHILSVPISETMTPYPGQTQYQALQQTQPYAIYPQTTQTYGLPPFGALWPGMKPESGLIQTPSPSQHNVLTCTTGLTTSQPCPAHYSYPIQASTTNASPVSTSSTVINISTPAVASISHQVKHLASFSSLGHIWCSFCFQIF